MGGSGICQQAEKTDAAVATDPIDLEKENRQLRKTAREQEAMITKLKAELASAGRVQRETIIAANEKEARLREESAKAYRELEMKVRMPTKDERELRQSLQSLEERNKVLERRAREISALSETQPCFYDALHAMAVSMAKPLKKGPEEANDEWGEVEPTFQQRVNTLVTKSLQGSGMGLRDIGVRQSEVFGLLNTVYIAAAAKKQPETYVMSSGGMWTVDKKRRRQFDEFGNPF